MKIYESINDLIIRFNSRYSPDKTREDEFYKWEDDVIDFINTEINELLEDFSERRTEWAFKTVNEINKIKNKKKTLKQVEQLTGIKADNLRQRIARGTLKAIKLGRDWFIDDKEVEKIK